MPCEVVSPSGCYGDGGWVGEVVMLRLDCVAEVPDVGCLELVRLLVLWTVRSGFQRVTTVVSKSSDRPARSAR